jgi:hypothetical protein
LHAGNIPDAGRHHTPRFTVRKNVAEAANAAVFVSEARRRDPVREGDFGKHLTPARDVAYWKKDPICAQIACNAGTSQLP